MTWNLASMTKVITAFKEIFHNYDAIFCDLWGCLHDGVESFPNALLSLKNFKRKGGVVVLITNAPRPNFSVKAQIDKLGITNEFYDSIITSGDAAQLGLFSGNFGTNVYHMGPKRDLSFFDINSKRMANPVDIKLVELEKAESIVCTGLFDDQIETPEDYTNFIKESVKKKLKLLCINPDMMVDYGEKRLWCAGAIAAAYSVAGGIPIYFGKPHTPIYEMAYRELYALGHEISKNRILCVGDGINTDILGGNKQGLDTLFVCGGLASFELGVTKEEPIPKYQILKKFLALQGSQPTVNIGYLK